MSADEAIPAHFRPLTPEVRAEIVQAAAELAAAAPPLTSEQVTTLRALMGAGRTPANSEMPGLPAPRTASDSQVSARTPT